MGLKLLDLFSGIGGFSLAAQWVWGDELEIVAFCEIDKFCQKVLKKHWPDVPIKEDIRTFLRQDSHVKTFLSQGEERDSPENKRGCGENWQDLLRLLNQNGLSSKMFPDFSLQIMDKIWPKLSEPFPKSGIAWSGQCLTLNISEWPKDASGCGLSEVLETSVPQKYYLSLKAIKGMINRSKKWSRGGYVLLQELGKDMTQRLKRMSLQQLEHLLQNPMEIKAGPSQTNGTQSLLPQSEQQLEETQVSYGKTLTLRKLTPMEKEKLMGFPVNWTVLEENL